MMIDANNTPTSPVAHLSVASLNARAEKAAATVAQGCISLRDNEALAFEAAQRGCAHLGHVEALETAARRAVQVMAQKAIIRFV